MGCELILALDVPDRAAATRILDDVSGTLRWVKIGLQMFTAHGPEWVREVAGRGFDIFLDLKLHDIPHTVARAVDSLSPLPIRMLTLHAAGGREMMAAAQAAARPDLWLLGVTVLTSMDGAGLAEIGVAGAPAEQVRRLGKLAVDAGIPGLVCSPMEISVVRGISSSVKLITPGIRPKRRAPSSPKGLAEAGAAAAAAGVSDPGYRAPVTDDQKRVMTPGEAARAGADFIVVGRPVLEAADRSQAVRDIMQQCRAQP